MKNIVISIVLLLSSNLIVAQEVTIPQWGVFSKNELEMKVYDKDSTANAVILTEIGNVYVQEYGDYKIEKEIYVRIKILSKEGFKHATIEIPTYKKQKIKDIKASTTNFTDAKKTIYINKQDIYKTKTSEDWNLTSFTLPDIKIGSIIEYKYTLISPYHHTFADGWVFQDEIPKIESIYIAKIPGFWQYHISTVNMPGIKPIEHRVIKRCMKVGTSIAGCLFIIYKLNDIPAYIDEDYATSKYNYLKQVRFELKTMINSLRDQFEITKTWKSVDKEIFKDQEFGKKYNKISFIKKRIPPQILEEKNRLTKAKNIYSFIQHHFNWNEKFELFQKYNYKNDFNSRVGNVVSINMSLVNALLAADIPADFVLLSTRQNGFVKTLHPTISSFNYLVAHVNINGDDYFLDATDKNLPFGTLPFKCLNLDFRVFDKEEGSYWYTYMPKEKSETALYSIAEITDDESAITMKTRVVYTGYNAYYKRKEIKNLGIEDYKDQIASENDEWEMEEHTVLNLKDIDKPLIETYLFNYEIDLNENETYYLKPFVINSFDSNPFKLKSRISPINLGYTKKYKYNMVLKVSDKFKIKSIPESKKAILAKNGGNLLYLTKVTENKVSINFSFSLNKILYEPSEYTDIKDFISLLIKTQEERIILTKK